MPKKAVLILGLMPELIDFSGPDFAAFPGLNAAKVHAGLEAGQAHLNSLGYDAQICLTDFGETAAQVVTAALQQQPFDCIMIGAGIRNIPQHFLLFERLVNVIHAQAPQAKICFNTKPDDTDAAVQRWI